MARNRFSGLLPTEMTLFDSDDALFREIRRLPVERFRLFSMFNVLTVPRALGARLPPLIFPSPQTVLAPLLNTGVPAVTVVSPL